LPYMCFTEDRYCL